MDSWQRFNEISLPGKKKFQSNLIAEGIMDADHKDPRKACKEFEINDLDKYHDLHVQSDTLQLEEVFESWRVILKQFWIFEE